MNHVAKRTARVASELANLPPLPSLIRYRDPYTESYKSVRNPAQADCWAIDVSGKRYNWDFCQFSDLTGALARRTLAWGLQRYAPHTLVGTFRGLVWFAERFGDEGFLAPFRLTPLELKEFWIKQILPALIEDCHRATGLKRYLFFLCDMSLGCLTPGYEDFVSAFPGPKEDLYASVRSADSFLTEIEELSIINYLDDLSARAARQRVSANSLRAACVLIASFQYAMRPIQIAKVSLDDVQVRLASEPTADGPIVHVRFHREKQHDSNQRLPMLRKVKREWAILFTQYKAVRESGKIKVAQTAVRNSFFGLTPAGISQLIVRILKQVLLTNKGATDLRHTAAQRMVDSGASHEELSEFLGHSHLRTGNVYFSASATQAERLNKALVTSRIYSAIATIHRTKVIDKAHLESLPPDHQVGGAPHGIPIAGIGGCELGQSLCTKNPVLSCYGCRKFLPVKQSELHQDVCDSLRPIVQSFFHASRGEIESPAYTQLRRTIAAVEQVIADIRADN
jgi:integrase